ncbi:MAG: complex I NDUFA9 subunit family protein [Alphaproteobacteria bacterium 41-28]|nr:MAG: complex I NDUFA9 subunit family protein [Alphaproteobacteria bacterium 41-28]
MRTVTIFGGSGFVGRYMVQKFADKGDLIRVAVRNPIAANFLKPLGEVGQITPVQASILSSDDIARAIHGADVVINLVGILYEKGSQTFESVHVEGARRVAEKASEMGVSTLLHMSALGANKASPSRYASSKAHGEEAVLKHFPQATIFRPSVIFGAEDQFLNRFAQMALISPFLPLIGGGKTLFQPIYVGDVGDCFLKASFKTKARGCTYEVGGPSIYSFKALMKYLLKTIHRKRLLIPLPFWLAKGMATFTQFLPNPPLTPDQVELLKSDNVVSSDSLKTEDLGIRPKALEALVPLYLARYSAFNR